MSDMSGLRKAFAEFAPDVLGCTAYSSHVEEVKTLFAAARPVLPEARFVIGGPHPTCIAPELVFDHIPGLDFVFRGEGEPGFVRFLELLGAAARDFFPGSRPCMARRIR